MYRNTSRLAQLPAIVLRRRLLTLGMIAMMVLASAGITMAQGPETAGSTSPVTVTITTLEVTQAGRTWEDDGGEHLRGQHVQQELSGDLSGAATSIVNWDRTPESTRIWITAQVKSDSGPWSYRAIFTAGPDGVLELYSATLVGQGRNAEWTIVLDRLLESTDDSYILTGQRLEQHAPTEPLNVHFDVCITSFTTVAGAFSGTIADLNGDFAIDDRDVDAGAMVASFLVGGPVESGLVMGRGRLDGEHGALEFELVVDRYGPHGIGKAVFRDGTGAYAGVVGTTKMQLADKANEACPLGIGSSGRFFGSTSREDGAEKARVHVLHKGSNIHGANGVAVGPDGQVYVASIAGREIVVYDPSNGRVQMRLGPEQGVEGPDDVAFGLDGSLYWTELFSGNVGRMSPDGTVTSQFVAVGVNPITISDDGRLFVGLAFVGDGLYELDPELQEAPRLVRAEFGFLNGFDFGPDGFLYSPNIATDSIIRIDVESGESEVVTDAVTGPSAVQFNSQGQLHATEFVGGRVVQVDIETGEVTPLAQLPTGVDNLAFDAADRLFVTHATDAFVARMLPNGNLRYLERPGSRTVGDLALLPGDRLFLADGFALREIDRQSGRQLDVDYSPLVVPGQMTTPGTADAFGEQLILSSWFGGDVQIWDPEQNQVIASWFDFSVPINAIDFQGDLIVAELGTGQVSRASMDDSSQREVLLSGAAVPSGLAASNDDLWAADWATGMIWQIVRDGQTLSDPIPIASGLAQPEGMTLDRDGALLVVESGAGRLIRIDPESGTSRTIADGLATGAEGIPGLPPTWFFSGVAVDSAGTIYVTGDVDNVIYRIER